MQRRQARSADPLYDTSAVPYPASEQKTATYATPYEIQKPVLGPGLVQSSPQYAVVTYPSATLYNPVMQQVEYGMGVADPPGAEQRWPVEYQHMAWTYYSGNSVPQQMH